MSSFHPHWDAPASHMATPGNVLAAPPLLAFLQSADPAEKPAAVHLGTLTGAEILDGRTSPFATITLCGQRFSAGAVRRAHVDGIDATQPPCPLCLHVLAQPHSRGSL